jgi:hypothetical protein
MAWGDILEPSVDMAKRANINYICYDWLAEVTMSILYTLKQRNAKAGYPPELIEWMRTLLPITTKRGIKIITNGGGANVEAACEDLYKAVKEAGLDGLKIGMVLGDDITERLDELRGKGIKFTNMDTGEEDIDSIKDRIVGAYVYIGAEGIVDCLKQGADVVIGGRLSDNAMYVGPWMYEFGWDYREPYWNKIGAAVTCGHIIECSCCCTGGMMCSWWNDVPEPWNIGYPIVELDEEGNALITKTPDSGGFVNSWTAKEHLVYESHDPKNYIMPDGIADFTTLQLDDVGKDMVKVTNMSGKPRPDKLKVGIGYTDGWKQELQHWFCWPDALKKAKHCEFIMEEWLKRQEIKPERMHVDYMGFNMAHGSLVRVPEPEEIPDLPEVGLRICAKFKTRKEAEYFRAHNYVWSSPQAGWVFNTTTAPARPTRVIALWPTLVPREEVHTGATVKEVK